MNTEDATRSKPLRTYPEIDGIRGVLSVIVVWAHLVMISEWPHKPASADSPIFWVWGCMEIFFCISGFLITSNLLRSAQRTSSWVAKYLAKRSLRIWPAYYVAFATALLVSLSIPLSHGTGDLWQPDWGYVLKTLAFLQYTEIYVGASSEGAIPAFNHSWSVALEEQFYIAILLVVFIRTVVGVFPGRRILIPILLALPVTQLCRYTGFTGWTLLGRADGFLLGMALAFLLPDLQRLKAHLATVPVARRQMISLALGLSGLVLLLPYFAVHGTTAQLPSLLRYGIFEPYFGFGVFALGLLASIVVAPITPLHKALATRPIMYLGTISYSTYLFHFPVLLVLDYAFRSNGVPGLWLYVSGPPVILAVSSVGFRFIEQPFLTLKSRF